MRIKLIEELPMATSAELYQLSWVIEQLLADHILERLRAAQGVLALLKPYGQARLEAACARAGGKVKAFANKWGYESVETDWRKLIQRDDIDPRR